MVKIKRAIFGIAATAAIVLLPMAPAMAGGPGFRPLHPFGIGHGLFGAAVALATLPLAIASSVVSGVGGSVAPYPSAGYAGPAYGYAPPVADAPRPYYAPYPGYYPRVAPRAYGPRGYGAPHPGYYGRGYDRSGGNSYPRR
jgi:hypothetical protein